LLSPISGISEAPHAEASSSSLATALVTTPPLSLGSATADHFVFQDGVTYHRSIQGFGWDMNLTIVGIIKEGKHSYTILWDKEDEDDRGKPCIHRGQHSIETAQTRMEQMYITFHDPKAANGTRTKWSSHEIVCIPSDPAVNGIVREEIERQELFERSLKAAEVFYLESNIIMRDFLIADILYCAIKRRHHL
jgi:hypothetical protein